MLMVRTRALNKVNYRARPTYDPLYVEAFSKRMSPFCVSLSQPVPGKAVVDTDPNIAKLV
jgi:hypothetical protein